MKIVFENAARAQAALPSRLKIVAVCVGAALAQCAADVAHADSAVGVDTAIGNAMSPPGRPNIPREITDDFDDSVRHSPTGQIYNEPAAVTDPVKTDGGWEYNANADIGVMGGLSGQRNALFRQYKDLHNGLDLDFFSATADKPDTARYVQASGGGVGRDDQFYDLRFGRYNDWKVKVFYSGTPHVFTDTYKSLYNGTGTGNLRLAGGLQANGGAVPVTSGAPTVGTGACTAAAPCFNYGGRIFSNATALAGINWTGGATTAAGTPIGANSIAGTINNYLNTVPADTELALLRKKAGVSGEVKLTDTWTAYASYTNEQRTGARPFSMNENNYTVEIPEPIDYTTHDFLAGASYTDKLTQLNLRLSASLFRNNIGTLTVQQPWLAVANGLAAAQTTIFDLYPDNDAFNAKAEFARNLPDFFDGRFTANAAFGTMRQNDALQMPVDPTQSAQIASALGTTVVAGVNNPGYANNTLDLNNWNGVNGLPLSQASAEQRIDTHLLDAGLLLHPSADLDVKGEVRMYQTDNKGGYIAYNPLTGQFGRGFRNSSAFDLVVGSSGAPGAIGVPCFVLPGFPAVPGCTFNGNAGVSGQGTNNPANIPVFSPAREVRQTNYTLSAGYDLGTKAGSIDGTLEREDFHRSFRERDQTWEDKFKLGYVNRGFELGTLRASYEYGRRRGSDYEFWPGGDFGTGLPGLDWNTIVSRYFAAVPGWTAAPAALQGILARYAYESRKFDLSDRNQQVLNARLNLMPADDFDVGLTLQYKDVKYPDSGYGLEKDRLGSFNLDLTYQPSEASQFFGYYSLQRGTRSMRANTGTNAANASNTCTFAAGAALSVDQVVTQCALQVWTANGLWNLDSTDRNDVLGVGFQIRLPYEMRLGLDYEYSWSKTTVSYDYAVGALTAAQALVAGSAFPDMKYVQNTLTANLLVPIRRNVAARLVFRHESARVVDWHYAGEPIGASAAENNATLMLDGGPQNYHTNMIGLFLQMRL